MSTQVVLITGGLSGIGRAAAVAFARKGNDKIVGSVREGLEASEARILASEDIGLQRIVIADHFEWPNRPEKCWFGSGTGERSADFVDQTEPPARHLLDLREFQVAALRGGRKQRLALAGDQRIDDEAQLIHQPGLSQAVDDG